jgi:transcriptional regulator with XRE-family HTH domain
LSGCDIIKKKQKEGFEMIVVNDEFKTGVGKRLRKLREGQELTINEVVERLSNNYFLDVDEKSIRRYEKGDFLPKIDNLICLAELYDTTLDYIVYGKETSDDNSFTWYDTFKRLNRLIYSLAVGFGKGSEDGKIYLELWDDEAKVYYEKLQSFSTDSNYKFEHIGKDPVFSVKDLDNLFSDFKENKKQLKPNEDRFFKYLKSQGIDPEVFKSQRIKEIKEKRED